MNDTTTTTTTTISAVVTVDDKHLFSHKPSRKEILKYFETDQFNEYAMFADVDDELLVHISEGLTNFIRTQSETVEELDWANSAVAVCNNAKVGRAKGGNAAHIIFSIAITSTSDI